MSEAVQTAAKRLRDAVESALPTQINGAFIDRLQAELGTIRRFARERNLTPEFELVEGRVAALAVARSDVANRLQLLESAVYGLYMSVSQNADS